MFRSREIDPFKNYTKTKRGADAIVVKVSFKHGDNKLLVEKWTEPEKQ